MREIQTFIKIRIILLQTLVIMLITLSLGEIALRIYNHYIPSFVFYSGSYERWRGKPFADDWDFKLNSLGFKDEEFPDKKENVYRILGIGDSFSYGVVPYRYNYLTLIESQLHLQNSNVEILNMGIPSIGPTDYLSLLVKEGLPLQPDMILLSFFIGNDFENSKKRELYEYSYIASLLHYIFTVRTKYEGSIVHGKAKYCDVCPNYPHEVYLQIESQQSLNYLVGNSQFYKKLDRSLYYLNKIKKICKTKGIDLVTVIIPDELQINKDLWRDLRKTYYPNIKSDQWDIIRPNRMLSDELDKRGIDNIDLYEYFAAGASSQRLYRPRDTHWNIAGNQLAADIIKKYIKKYL
ncbi:MAG: hypothetical protein D3924_18985 [Candidatus Electrothrix sp. AR4]|nr:hypothetical protein [Candidatus Electrothrix sp. AR4]